MKKSIVLLLMLFSLTWLAAQTTGKIKGVVKDGQDPLPGAYVILEGTTQGAQADESGYFYIIGVRAGTYNVKCQFTGYKPMEKKAIVKVGLTETVNFSMVSSDVELDAITVISAQEPTINKSETSGKRTVSTEDVGKTSATDVSEVISSQSGVKKDASGELHFRGGRSGEVGYVIDGVSTGDPTGAKTSSPVSINFANVESFSIQKGVADAEYGDALSGSVNIVMKVGDQKKTSVFTKYYTDAFFGDNKFDLQGGEFSLNGPMPFTEGLSIRPTYYIATDMSSQNGFKYSYRRPGTTDYYDFGSDDVTGFGFDMPIKRDNNFNVTFKTAYDITNSMKLSASIQSSKSVLYPYTHYMRYSPESAAKTTENVLIGNLNFNHVVDQSSFYDVVFSYYNRKYESLPMAKNPNQFMEEKETDNIFQDVNRNGLRDGGDYEGFFETSLNPNGLFDREYFIDYNRNGMCDKGEPFGDFNMNGVWDGDILFDSNNDQEWACWDVGQSYNGYPEGPHEYILTYAGNAPMGASSMVDPAELVPEGKKVTITGTVLEGKFVEGYRDFNVSGHYDIDIYKNVDNNGLFVDQAEPFADGDLYQETGEPFVDWAVLVPGVVSGTYVLKADGVQYSKTLTVYNIDSVGLATSYSRGYVPSPNIEDYLYVVKTGPGASEFKSVTYKKKGTVANRSYELTYPPEAYVDLPSTLGSHEQINLRPNQTYNAPDYTNPTMDEFEAYTYTRRNVLCQTIADYAKLGYVAGSNVPYRWEGTYSGYAGIDPSEMNQTADNLLHDKYSTWIDRNGNGKYDANDGKWQSDENYSDYDKNGRWNNDDQFANPGEIYMPNYSNHDNSVYKLKANYSKAIDKYNLLKTGLEFTLNDLNYLTIENVHRRSDSPNDLKGEYPGLGDNRTIYNYKPINFSAYIQDKMEFEDLVLSVGARFDSRYMNDDIKKDYELKKEQQVPGYEEEFKQLIYAFSPRFGVSHSITEFSKLYFGYGHFSQLPDYTKIFDPNTGGKSTDAYGNMNLGYQRNVQYELGVVQEFGDYTFDVSTYFKDVYDLLSTKKYKDAYNREKNVWVNSDYGKTRGIEIAVDKGLTDHYMWNLSYTLSYAYGKSSDASDNNDKDASEIKIRENPLDWDERHVLNSSFSIVYGEKEEFMNLPYMDDWSINLSSDFGSGLPFTPTVQYYRDENGVNTKTENDIERNSERMPWTSNTNLRLSKSFNFNVIDGEKTVNYGKIKFDFDVLNLFDKINVLEVYDNTGKWYDPGEVADKYVLSELPDRAESYANPQAISERRSYKFSVSYNW